MPDAPRRPERIAHRGASRELLENTLPAFELALDRGADAIELDVHRTRDGVVVVHHDEGAGGHEITATDWGVLAGVRLSGDAGIPRLDDVLAMVGDRAAMYVELKGRGVAQPALDVCRRLGKRYAVHSFDHDAIARALKLAPEVPRGVLLHPEMGDPLEAMAAGVGQTRARDVWPHYSLVDEQFMKLAHRLGVRVITWTVNATEEARRLSNLGVAGLCTDDVRLIDTL